ncbi:hypothetical protein HGM15179_018852 [Zosterops borbonicus]|uniref:Uncharacterized protein n=1 Tax=Zosterops borbonicus TaxID=364589 RepID=A0A8K1DAE3_9PASS|nr:hypothetical protein HGM15179_018852 [Zosterops borbonicus]
MAMNQMNHLNTIANMAAAAQMHSPLSRAGASVIKERIQDSPSPAPSLEESQRPGSHASSHPSSSVSSSPSQLDTTPDRIAMLTNSREGELIDQETGASLKKIQKEKAKQFSILWGSEMQILYFMVVAVLSLWMDEGRCDFSSRPMAPEPEPFDDIIVTRIEILKAPTLYIQDSKLILNLSERQIHIAISVGTSGFENLEIDCTNGALQAKVWRDSHIKGGVTRAAV